MLASLELTRDDGVRGPTTTGGIYIKMNVTWADAG